MLQFFVDSAAIGVGLIAVVISFFISFLYKLMINQKEAKANKDEMKTLREKMKELAKSGKQKDAMEEQKRMMELSRKQMMSTFKPMVVTLLLVLPIFAFLMPNLYGIDPVKIEQGSGSFTYQGQTIEVTYSIDDEGKIFESGEYKFEYGKYNAKRNELLVRRIVAETPISIPFAGKEVGWLGWYVLVSIPTSILSRKMLGVV